MAYFDDLGKHCSRPDCNQRDFLPISCDLCSKVHCRDHAGYEAHDCPRKAVKDRRVMLCPLCDATLKIDPEEAEELTWERHAATAECRAAAAKKAKNAEAGLAPPKPPRCPAKGCKEKLTAISSYTCPACRQTVCMRHRFEDAHPCKDAIAAAARPRPPQPGPAAAAAARQQDTRSCCAAASRDRAARAAEERRMISGVGMGRLMRRMLGNASPLVRAK